MNSSRGKRSTGTASGNRSHIQSVNQRLNNLRIASDSQIKQVGKNKQLLSVPAHTYGLNLETFCRYTNTDSTTGRITLTTAEIRSLVFNDLGIAAPESYSIVIEEIKAYATIAGTQTTGSVAQDFLIQLHDRTTGSISDQDFGDFGTTSGVAHIHLLLPIFQRIEISQATTATLTYLDLFFNNPANIVVDFKVRMRSKSHTITRLLGSRLEG
jgi:hypothetical protein